MNAAQDRPILFCPVGDARHHASLRDVCTYAMGHQVSVSVLAVVEEPSAWDRLAHSDHVERVEQDQSSAWLKTIDRWAKEFEEVTVVEVRIASTAKAIVERAAEIDASSIVLSLAHEREDLAVAKRVMRLGTRPVWVMRPTRAKARRILAAVNPEIAELDLNLEIMETAARLADNLDASLVLMTAWELYGEQAMRRSAFLKTPAPQFHDLFDLRKQISKRGLEELVAASSTTVEWTLHLEKGPPAPSILRAAQKHRSNLLVMGTVGRSGLNGLLMGNTAEHVLDGAHCSIYSLRAPSKDSNE